MFKSQTRRELIRAAIISVAGAACLGRSARAEESAKPAKPQGEPLFSFYAMDTGLRGPDVPTIEAKVALLKKLGYAGIGYSLGDGRLAEMLKELDKAGLELSAVYLTPSLEQGLPPRLEESVALMKGRRTRIELCINSKEFKPSDPAGDAKAVEMLKRAADLCGDSGPVVSVYPHRGSWTERVEDGVRLAAQAGRKTVGTHFNLVHWKWVPQTKSLDALLAEAMPHLKAVTINGMAGNQIVSLAEGDFDLVAFMAAVKKAGYRGLVGLQGYGIKGPSEEHLKKSMEKWREILAAISRV